MASMDDKPKRKDINKYVKPSAAHKWQDIGLELEVGDEDGIVLDEIRDKYGENQEECFDRMIALWLKDTDASQLTWRELLKSLESLKLNEAVKAVQTNVLRAADLKKKEIGANVNGSAGQMSECSSCHESHEQKTQAIEVDPSENEEVKRKPTSHSVNSDQPISVDGPPGPNSPPDAINYTLDCEGKSIRDYQLELAQPGIEGKNYIVVAPTGSGKTLVAAMVISDHLQKGRDSGEERRVAFIVDKRPLAQQQTEELKKRIPAAKIMCCIGDDSNTTVTSSISSGAHIIVCTAGKVLDDLRNGRLLLSEFSLMVFDECHHTRKKSPYAEVMIRYIREKLRGKGSKLPQVMGMTASPGAGDNPHLEKVVTIDHLVNLCALMDATSGIKTVQTNIAELEEHTNKPDDTIENSKGRDLSEPFIVNVVKLMQKLEKKVDFNCPFDRWDQQYETQVQQNKSVLEKNTNPESRDVTRVWELLRCLSRALDVYMELQFEDAVSVLERSELRKLQNPNERETELLHSLETLLSELKAFPLVNNPHLEKVKILLEDYFKNEPKSRVMLFVRTKKHASSIYNWIKSLPVAKDLGINPCMAVGQVAGNTGDGMTQAEQESAFQRFREGRSNLLVVTSIGEEGLDVPACNLILRYQHVSNEIAKAQTLGRARAKGVSEGHTILSSSKKHMQEIKNGELLALVNRILHDSHFPSGPYLERKIEEEQEILLKKADCERARIEQHKSTYRAEDVHLFCILCKTPACCAADIRIINKNCYVVPGEEFQSKIDKITHAKPIQKAAMSITQKILCKNCRQSWGISCVWPKSQNQFPVLSCKSFTFMVGESPITVKKWSEAPFIVEEFSGFLRPEEEDSD